MSALALAVRIAVTENLKKIPNHMKQKTIVPALPFLLPSLFGVGVFYAVPFAVSKVAVDSVPRSSVQRRGTNFRPAEYVGVPVKLL